MIWSYFFTSIAVLLVAEGIMPFLSPMRWRKFVHHLILQSDGKLRIMGFISMLIGMMIMLFVHSGIISF